MGKHGVRILHMGEHEVRILHMAKIGEAILYMGNKVVIILKVVSKIFWGYISARYYYNKPNPK